jgi:fimbrial chaperone protein
MSAMMRAVSACVAALVAIFSPPAAGVEYTVSPMRLELSREARSGVVTLTNTGTSRIDFQMTAMEWTQDNDGADHYAETGEIIFFPKILTLAPNEDRVIRVGAKSAPAATERTFRLFIERIPAPLPEPLAPGAHISVNIRFALPIFVRPVLRKTQGEFTDVTLAKSELAVTLRNAGNEHFLLDDGVAVSGRTVRGEEILVQRISDRYLLAGVAKRYTASIAKHICVRLATLEVTAKTQQFTLSRKLDVDPASCG